MNKVKAFTVGRTQIRLHRKEQWDLKCWPWLCVHVERVKGLQIGSRLWVRQ